MESETSETNGDPMLESPSSGISQSAARGDSANAGVSTKAGQGGSGSSAGGLLGTTGSSSKASASTQGGASAGGITGILGSSMAGPGTKSLKKGARKKRKSLPTDVPAPEETGSASVRKLKKLKGKKVSV